MKILLLVTAVIGVACGFSRTRTVPDYAIQDLQSLGAQYLGSVITQQNQAVTDALEKFKPINASCMAKYEAALAGCGSCVNDKCVARAKRACKPSDWQIILGQTANFVTQEVPDFFTDIVPDFFEDKVGGAFVDLGGESVDVTKDVGDFFETGVGGPFVDLGGEIEDTASDVGKFFGDVGGELEGEFEDIGSTIGGGIGDIAGRARKFFGGIVGRKKRSLYRARRSTQPSCSQLKANATVACRFYLSSAYCTDCGFSTAQDCRRRGGYDAALERLQAASATTAWMSKATTTSYKIVKVQYNPTNRDSTGKAYRGVEVAVHLFGMDMAFTVSQPIQPYFSDPAGPIIAAQALQLFMSA